MAPQVFCQPLSLHSVYANSAHSEIQLDSAAYKLKSSTAGVVGLQDTQRAGEPGAPLDGGSRWPSYSMWCRVAAVFLVWAPVEDWEAVDGSPDGTGKLLQAVRSHSLSKVAGTAAGPVGRIFLTPLKANMDG